MTLKEFREVTKNCNENARIVFRKWESCITDAGTDMGDYNEFEVNNITDLETRIELEFDEM